MLSSVFLLRFMVVVQVVSAIAITKMYYLLRCFHLPVRNSCVV